VKLEFVTIFTLIHFGLETLKMNGYSPFDPITLNIF